jgi:hypothetical protein
VRDLDWGEKFHSELFELERMGRVGTDDAGAVYLSDGVVNLALIKVAPDFPNAKPDGLNHIGFVVSSGLGADGAHRHGNRRRFPPRYSAAGPAAGCSLWVGGPSASGHTADRLGEITHRAAVRGRGVDVEVLGELHETGPAARGDAGATPAGRPGSPEDVVAAVVYLASAGAS